MGHFCTMNIPHPGVWCWGHRALGCPESGHPCTSGTPGPSHKGASCTWAPRSGGTPCWACPAPRPQAPSQPTPYLGASTRQRAWGPWGRGMSGARSIYSVRREFYAETVLFCTRRLPGRAAGSGAPLVLSGLCNTRFLHPAFVRGGCWRRRAELFLLKTRERSRCRVCERVVPTRGVDSCCLPAEQS